ncbi:MAG: DUF5677 domain-containing protein [Phenylobacterium sp.]|uniref:DUF2336 domain-containing protein n=1 Tax=Brevundimonas mediterranea TaxID=74329 RepID=A0AB37E923_9CAUL|nr:MULTISPECIES: DUF5677 domain-containing protein [Brevundimonas]MDZ4052523.1 DUF5677 domain-containing protein [Phenylobacterium sp.]MBA4332778.1 hypothetical protein [Brevundimonas sp.]MDZ4317526.1 DUF5677 domain-containing protein [Phenylobacterium sp.]MDZ4369944.1 DUF5677 domain-containing protein [Phenylobacterium sp.]QIH73930.1 hypothetical protein GYM46_13790 [Brevundimonas mediterranea]
MIDRLLAIEELLMTNDRELRDAAWTLLITQRNDLLDEVERWAEPTPIQRVLLALFQLLGDRGRGVLALLNAGLDWDGEIVLRSFYECASKIMYLATSSESDRPRRIHEFEVILAEASDKRRSRKAAFAEAVFDDHSATDRDVFRALQHPDMVRNSESVSKKERQAIEGRWSFSGIIEQLAAGQNCDPVPEATSLLHIYGMASHLAHSDAGALDMMEDRARRGSDERELLEAAHRARIVSDLASLSFYCGLLMETPLGATRDWKNGWIAPYKTVMALSAAARDSFYPTQKEFYDQMLRGGKKP